MRARVGSALIGTSVAAGLVVGCSADPPPEALPSLPPAASERVQGELGGVALELEVADDPRERSTGLMGRTSVPPGTGMVFLYDSPTNGRFYMHRVPIPLRATFIADGRVVSSIVMPPCPEQKPQDCPTYGADGPFDTVVETDPATLPDVAPGDAFDLSG